MPPSAFLTCQCGEPAVVKEWSSYLCAVHGKEQILELDSLEQAIKEANERERAAGTGRMFGGFMSGLERVPIPAARTGGVTDPA